MSTVLVIDDETWVLRNVSMMLEMEGHTVYKAENGEAGLAIVREHLPDLVICDVTMPGMSGFEVLTALQADSATDHVPVVMITGIRDDTVTQSILSCGASAFLHKPFSRDELFSLIAPYL